MQKPVILTNDPSFTEWGWVVLKDNKVIAKGCIKTHSEHKKRRIRVGDDRIRRTDDILDVIIKIIKQYGVNYMLSEMPHGSQNAAAADMVGTVRTALQTISKCLGIPIEWYSEADAKKAVLGKKTSTKQEMVKAINKLYKVDWFKVKYKDQAVADALAIHYTACHQSPTLKFLNGGSNGT